MAQVILPNTAYQRPAHIWDHAVCAAGANLGTSVPYFSSGIGQSGLGVTGRTKFDINLQQGNRQNPGEAFALTQLGFRFNPNMKLSDIFGILNAYYFEMYLQTQGAVFADGPLWMYPSGAGVSGVSTNNAESVWDIGVPDLRAGRAWGVDDGYPITDQMYVGVTLIGGANASAVTNCTGVNGIDLWCILDGLKTTLVHG